MWQIISFFVTSIAGFAVLLPSSSLVISKVLLSTCAIHTLNFNYPPNLLKGLLLLKRESVFVYVYGIRAVSIYYAQIKITLHKTT